LPIKSKAAFSLCTTPNESAATDEKEYSRRIRRRPLHFWIHDVNHRREVYDKVYAKLKKAPCPV